MNSLPLEYFLRVAEMGSITKSANELRLSQPALSRHMAALERELGVALFTRSHGGVQLTEAGQLLADRARPILRQLSILKEQMGEHATGLLSIGIPPSWHQVFTQEFAARIITNAPGIKLRVYEGASNLLREYMAAGLLDLAIVPFQTNPTSGYCQTSLIREPAMYVGTEQDGLRANQFLPVSTLDGKQLVLPSRPNGLRLQIEHALARKNLFFKIAAEVDTLTLCLTLARSGHAHTVVPSCALYDKEAARGLSWSPLSAIHLTWTLCENDARTHSIAVREGKRLALELIAARVQEGGWQGAEKLNM
ncbi:LysR family transcriptional regulator [Herbaspirillum autotrophicum]|uniref:LysR family transcriptional regulator n=1 Tax=Herbaspirillum autotrophicum TaxID=180195 RepID=UPI00067B0293|nr:LysR family transcriptional regulator [Herbaspirillum autotrophicum]